MKLILAIYIILTGIFSSGCTYNLSLVNNSGEATDTIDTSQVPTSDFKSDLEIPVKPL